MASGQQIKPGTTLIIFDEVQDAPKVINSLKYFCENAAEYHIACADSLLSVALTKPLSFPIGKVSFLKINSMSFLEFFIANDDKNLVEFMKSVNYLNLFHRHFIILYMKNKNILCY